MTIFKIEKSNLSEEAIEEIKDFIKKIANVDEEVKTFNNSYESFMDDEIDFRLRNFTWENMNEDLIEYYAQYIKDNNIFAEFIIDFDKLDYEIQSQILDFNELNNNNY